jgi:hypothetical protein
VPAGFPTVARGLDRGQPGASAPRARAGPHRRCARARPGARAKRGGRRPRGACPRSARRQRTAPLTPQAQEQQQRRDTLPRPAPTAAAMTVLDATAPLRASTSSDELLSATASPTPSSGDASPRGASDAASDSTGDGDLAPVEGSFHGINLAAFHPRLVPAIPPPAAFEASPHWPVVVVPSPFAAAQQQVRLVGARPGGLCSVADGRTRQRPRSAWPQPARLFLLLTAPPARPRARPRRRSSRTRAAPPTTCWA